MNSLASMWLDQLSGTARDSFADCDELEKRLRNTLDEARANWPGVSLSDEDALVFLAERIDSSQPAEVALAKIHSDDLFLCCACLAGNETAITLLRKELQPTIRGALARYGDPSFSDDVAQQLYARMLVSQGGKPSHLNKYRGTGRLASWFRIAALREANNNLRRHKKEVVSEIDKLLDRVVEVSDPELATLKSRYREQFKTSFQEAFTRLTPRQRNVLRHQYIEGLNLDRIALLYDVARSTVAYWRSGAREKLFKETRAIFRKKIGVSNDEFASIMRLIDSQLEVSMSRILRLPDEPNNKDELA
jgi:RNA polymerase sigma-70 factor (ECF subfamily)